MAAKRHGSRCQAGTAALHGNRCAGLIELGHNFLHLSVGLGERNTLRITDFFGFVTQIFFICVYNCANKRLFHILTFQMPTGTVRAGG